MTIKVLAWLWEQNPPRHEFNAEKVNTWYRRAREAITIPGVRFACVTNIPEGLDPELEVIPLREEFAGVRINTWKEQQGAPQCYRRLDMWRRDAADYYGAEWLLSCDVDATFHGGPGSCNHLFTLEHDVRIFNGTHSKRPYNGGLVLLRAGARPQVYEEFRKDPAGVAAAARELYVGSDQAVISMILGPGEATWTAADGVYYFSPRFIRLHGGEHRCAPPPNLCLMFYPGNVKPWNGAADRFPWVRDAWNGVGVGRAAKPAKLRLRAYRDPKGWGQAFSAAAEKRGHFCSLFTRAKMVYNGRAFVRLDQQGAQRDISRGIVLELNRRGIKTLPTAREALWYDDKAAQIEPLRKWLPRTVYFRDQRRAAAWLREHARFPFVSKSVDGAGSKGVRVINTLEEALEELGRAFTAPGIPSVYDRRQLGYVYWQDLVPGNDCDYRVCVVGRYVYGLIRDVRPGTIFASGSGQFRPLTLETPRELAAARLGVEIADELRTQWLAFDIVFDRHDRPLVLELSSAWTMRAYESCPMFRRDTLERTTRTAAESFDVAVEVLEAM